MFRSDPSIHILTQAITNNDVFYFLLDFSVSEPRLYLIDIYINIYIYIYLSLMYIALEINVAIVGHRARRALRSARLTECPRKRDGRYLSPEEPDVSL